jgi:hypothetical protein
MKFNRLIINSHVHNLLTPLQHALKFAKLDIPRGAFIRAILLFHNYDVHGTPEGVEWARNSVEPLVDKSAYSAHCIHFEASLGPRLHPTSARSTSRPHAVVEGSL